MINFLTKYKEAAVSAAFLAAALVVQFGMQFDGQSYVFLTLYGISYLAVGGPVWLKAYNSIKNGTIFSEFLLMGIATLGAFAIGEYAEGVAVMLFYMIGEYVQHGAVFRAKNSIKSLINQQPDIAMVERGGVAQHIHPSAIQEGEIIQVKPGEKVPLDGELINEKASFNTAALTGESKPMSRKKGEDIWAGSINQDRPVRIKVTGEFEDTKLSQILAMVQEAAKRKAPTERFITKFAKIYTPIVVWLAVGLTFLPFLFVSNYVFEEWFYRALIFLVVSCPCGLVISVPLGYFGGIGAASKNGILFKGSDFLDQLRKMKTLFIDKTGTLTKGSFEVQEVSPVNGFDENELLQLAASLEQQSTHPIGKAIVDYAGGRRLKKVREQQEISGRGLQGIIENKKISIGSRKLLEEQQISLHKNGQSGTSTAVFIAVDTMHAGTIYIDDAIKEDSKAAVSALKKQGVEKVVMLSGDEQAVADSVAKELEIDEAKGNLLPGQKYEVVKAALNKDSTVGFAGDGVNDAPVITLADVGIAMGGIGSDATIETADVVIQNDQPSKISTAIEIANYTHRIVWQNIGFALGIKVAVMGLAAVGLATMWEAIFADVGVAVIAIANAVRVQNHFTDAKFNLRATSSENSTETEEGSCCEECC